MENIHVAIVGSGPSGFYAAEALLRSSLPICVDMFERLPTPFGLVRSGVAPDHPKLKQSIQVFERIAQSPEFNFFGNVTVGEHIAVEDLRANYHAIIFACGAQKDRRLHIPGEDLAGSHTATEFVGWYNGHPDYRDRDFDLRQEVVAIVGQGNVAADVCRILTSRVDDLSGTDIAEHALEALSESKVREIHVIGRRGPVQAKFSPKELRELLKLPETVATIDNAALQLSPACHAELASRTNTTAQKNIDIFQSISNNTAGPGHRRIHFRFLASPVAIQGSGRVEHLSLARNRLSGEPFSQSAVSSGCVEELPCGLIFRSIGYHGTPIPGVPFDSKRGVLPNSSGRLKDGDDVLPGFYVTGWLKRGPSGIIGTNKADSIETVAAVITDLENAGQKHAPGLRGVLPALERLDERIISFEDWRQIDVAEIERGARVGKPREKFTRIDDMLGVVRGR